MNRCLQQSHSNLSNETFYSTDYNLLPEKYIWSGGFGISIIFAVLSLFLTSFIVCCHKSKVSNKRLELINSSLISLAVGSLFGDAIIHIIPDIYKNQSQNSEKKIPIVSVMIVIGFLTFFVIEKIFVFYNTTQNNNNNNKNTENINHSKEDNKTEIIKGILFFFNIELGSEAKNKNQSINLSNLDSSSSFQKINLDTDFNEKILNDNSPIPKINNNDTQIPKDISCEGKSINIIINKNHCLSLKNKKPVGILIIISSAIHNIMDGLAIGIVFSSRKIPVIISTSIAIALHEIPKELGDAGILIHSNFPIWSVLFWNSIVNITCIIGLVIGLSLGNLNEASQSYSMGFVAGNFLFISLAEMIPVILHKKGVIENICQFLFMIMGLLIMFLILLIENNY